MGDPACYLSSICLTCGRFMEAVDVSVCPHCGEEIEGTAGSELDALRTRGPGLREYWQVAEGRLDPLEEWGR